MMPRSGTPLTRLARTPARHPFTFLADRCEHGTQFLDDVDGDRKAGGAQGQVLRTDAEDDLLESLAGRLREERHRGVGRISALLWEDLKLALRGRTSLRGVWQGLFTR